MKNTKNSRNPNATWSVGGGALIGADQTTVECRSFSGPFWLMQRPRTRMTVCFVAVAELK